MAAVVLASVAVGSLVGAGPAGAHDVSAEELRGLVERATADPAALAELREVDALDGAPVDLGAALDGVDQEDLGARLAELSRTLDAAPVAAGRSAADERGAAAAILAGRDYHPLEAPKPFDGALRRIGGWLRPIGAALAPVADLLPAWAWGAVAVGVGAVALARLARGRVRAQGDRAADAASQAELDPEVLERAADEAERAGRLDEALRLRFRAGVLRLHRAGVLEDRPSRTTSELADQLASDRFAELAHDFDEVAYGERPVTPEELAAARAEWGAVLAEMGRRS